MDNYGKYTTYIQFYIEHCTFAYKRILVQLAIPASGILWAI